MTGRDPWQVLGIDPGSSVSEARDAYRRLAEIYHPDRYLEARDAVRDEAAQRMREVNLAWQEVQRMDPPGARRADVSRPPTTTATSSPRWTLSARALTTIGLGVLVLVLVVVGVVIGLSDDDGSTLSAEADENNSEEEGPSADDDQDAVVDDVDDPPEKVKERDLPTEDAPVETVPPPPGPEAAPWATAPVAPPPDLAGPASMWSSSPFPGCSFYGPTQMQSGAGYAPNPLYQFTRLGDFQFGWTGSGGDSVWVAIWPADNQNVAPYYDDPDPVLFADGSEMRSLAGSSMLVDRLISIPGEPCVYSVSCDTTVSCSWLFDSFRPIAA